MYMSALQVAAPEIAMIKVSGPNMALRVLDRAIQVIGIIIILQILGTSDHLHIVPTPVSFFAHYYPSSTIYIYTH